MACRAFSRFAAGLRKCRKVYLFAPPLIFTYRFIIAQESVYYSHLQAQDDTVAGWTDKTIGKIKQVLKKLLIEVEILDTPRSTRLNPLFLCEELEQGIRENNDMQALAAFNCFR